MKKRPTIKELQAILDANEDREIKILPNGEVRAVKGKMKKPVTFNENLGGEYGKLYAREANMLDYREGSL